MPSLTFSPPSFSSTASSITMFKKTYFDVVRTVNRNVGKRGPYIVSAQDANDLAAAVELDEETLVKILV